MFFLSTILFYIHVYFITWCLNFIYMCALSYDVWTGICWWFYVCILFYYLSDLICIYLHMYWVKLDLIKLLKTKRNMFEWNWRLIFARLVSDQSCLYLRYKVIITNIWIFGIISLMHWGKYFSCLLNIRWRYWTIVMYISSHVLCDKIFYVWYISMVEISLYSYICYARWRNICGYCLEFIV